MRPTELKAEAGDQVTVTGEIRNGRLVGEVEATESAKTGALATPRKVAVLLVTFPGDSAEPWPPEETRSNVFTGANSAKSFYEEESYGEISLAGKLNEAEGDVFGWISLESASTATCSFATWRNEANSKAATEGVDLSGYDHIIYVFPTRSVCSWLGIAVVNGDWAMINGNLGVHPIAHELGHNLGLEHAGSLTCFEGGQRVQISGSCAVSEYGDPFDVMGNIAPRHGNGWNLVKLGILGSDNIESAELSGTYSILSAFDETNEATILRVPRAKSAAGAITSWYYLEIRKTGGIFENVTDASTTGVSIRIPRENFAAETVLVDATPETATFADAPLQEGQLFDAGPVRITTLSAGGGEATVSVELDEEAPTAPSSLLATPEFDGVKLQWGASTDNVGVDRYLVFRDEAQVGSTEGTEFLDSRAPAGSHTYVVYAEDEFHNRSDASSAATASVPEFEGPTCESGNCKVTFRYSGTAVTWTVPPGVGEAEFTVEGARGGGRLFNLGGRVEATLVPLAAEEVVTVSIGGAGEPFSEGGEGGFGGGGDGTFGAGGGGFSSVTLGSDLMLLAAGGGGEGARGLNAATGQEPRGGWGGQGGVIGTSADDGIALTANGATLGGGGGGGRGDADGSGTDGGGGSGGAVDGSSSCVGGAFAGAPGADGSSLSGGGGAPNAGGGGGGGYVGGGQGGEGASDACGNRAGWGGGGGGSGFAAPGVKADFTGGVRSGDGQVWISYPNPVAPEDLTYTTEQDQELVVPAGSGVLSGAPGPPEVPLDASVVSSPSHGALALADDGGFTYEPVAGFTGIDSFAYSLADPSGHSATGQVNLRVARPPSATITTPSAGDTYTVEQAVPTTFSCNEGSGGSGLASCNDSGGIETSKGGAGLLDTSTAGIHTYTVTAVSTSGLAGTEAISYLVVMPRPPQAPVPPPPPPLPLSEFSLSLKERSLRKVLRTGRLVVWVSVSEGMSIALTGRAVLNRQARHKGKAKSVYAFRKRKCNFARPGTRRVALALTRRGRAHLRHRRFVRIAIVGKASGTTSEVGRRTAMSTLRRTTKRSTARRHKERRRVVP